MILVLETLKGARLKKLERFIDGDLFLVTYGDGVANIDINKLIDFHKNHGKIATITGVHPPARFGELIAEDGKVKSFSEKATNFLRPYQWWFFCF